LLPEKLHEVLMAQKDLKNKTGFVVSLNAENGVCYFYALVFTQKSLKQYDRKLVKQRVHISHPGGEVKVYHDAKPSKYAEIYLLTNDNNTFTAENITKKI
jgi:hypothetical protein